MPEPARRGHAAATWFFLILIQLVCHGFFTVYWLRENRTHLPAEDLTVDWLSDEDFRGLQASHAPNFTTADGRTLELPRVPLAREPYLGGFQVETPDGRWHGRVTARLASERTRDWIGLSIPVAMLSIVGIVMSLRATVRPGPKAVDDELG